MEVAVLTLSPTLLPQSLYGPGFWVGTVNHDTPVPGRWPVIERQHPDDVILARGMWTKPGQSDSPFRLAYGFGEMYAFVLLGLLGQEEAGGQGLKNRMQ